MMRRAAWVALALLAGCNREATKIPQPPASQGEAHTGLELPEGGAHLSHVQVHMRDGVRLDTDVWTPGPGRYPVVLIRTPYETEIGEDPVFLNRVLAEGYAIVQQHERGRFLSEGEMRMLGNADEDGWDTLEWIASQPWSNAKVATYGCSSSAENQLKLATLHHPAHKAMIAFSSGVGIAEAGPHKEQGNFWRGGVWQMGWANYFFEEMAVNWPQLPAGLSDVERQRLSSLYKMQTSGPITQGALKDARMHLPMADIGEVVAAPETELKTYLARGPHNAAWADDRVTDRDITRVPGLYAEALYDISSRVGIARFEQLRAANKRGEQAILITNGEHCAFGREQQNQHIGDRPIGDARYDYDAAKLAWLDRWLKDDVKAQTPKATVSAYMAGANRWAGFEGVGVKTTRAFYLSSNGKANTLNGDGVLLETQPKSAAEDRFRYDPADPVIAQGGEIAGMGDDQAEGAYDQRDIEKRADVLVYTSAPLDKDLAVFGPIEAVLNVASDAPDTDFTVKLVDVAPDGTAWNISESILRMRYRDGLDREVMMKADETYEIRPPPMFAASVFRQGHRVRLEVSSSNFPSYARNLNTAGNPYTTTETRVATNRVLHGVAKASRILLPVVTLPQN